VTKNPARNLVDTRNGHKFLLDPSGLQPIYVKKNVSINDRKKELSRVTPYKLFYEISENNKKKRLFGFLVTD
jgi:hypothetical protein